MVVVSCSTIYDKNNKKKHSTKKIIYSSKRKYPKNKHYDIPFLLLQHVCMMFIYRLNRMKLNAPPVFIFKIAMCYPYTIPMQISMETIQFGIKNGQFALNSSKSDLNISECLWVV